MSSRNQFEERNLPIQSTVNTGMQDVIKITYVLRAVIVLTATTWNTETSYALIMAVQPSK